MKFYIVLIVSFLMVLITHGQSFKGGVIAGISTSQYDGDSYSGYHRVGLDAGIYVGHDIGTNFSWQLEMKFIQKGSYQSMNIDAGIMHSYSLRLNYVELPFLLKYYNTKVKFTFEGGLGFGYLVSYSEKNENGVIQGSVPFNKDDINYQLGLSYTIVKRIIIDARFLYSVLPVRKTGGYNNGICFALLYQFKT